MMEKNLYPEIPKEKFAFIHKDERIHDEKLQTKSISYLAMRGCASARTSPPLWRSA